MHALHRIEQAQTLLGSATKRGSAAGRGKSDLEHHAAPCLLSTASHGAAQKGDLHCYSAIRCERSRTEEDLGKGLRKGGEELRLGYALSCGAPAETLLWM